MTLNCCLYNWPLPIQWLFFWHPPHIKPTVITTSPAHILATMDPHSTNCHDNHPKAAVMIWSHELMPTIPHGVLPMQTRVFTIIIVIMMKAATVALIRSPSTILALVLNGLFVLPHGFHPKAAIMIWSHKLMPTIPHGVLPIRTGIDNSDITDALLSSSMSCGHNGSNIARESHAAGDVSLTSIPRRIRNRLLRSSSSISAYTGPSCGPIVLLRTNHGASSVRWHRKRDYYFVTVLSSPTVSLPRCLTFAVVTSSFPIDGWLEGLNWLGNNIVY